MASAFHVNFGPDALAPVELRKIGPRDCFAALREGLDDFVAMPTHVAFLGLFYVLGGIALAALSSFGNALQLVFPFAAGFALVGPFFAIGLYELSRRRERGLPTANCRDAEQLDSWILEIEARLRRRADEAGIACAPICPNLIVHHSNARLADDLRIVLKHAPELVITSVGSPGAVVAPLHDAGALVFADVASIRHAGWRSRPGRTAWCCLRQALTARPAG
jgi:hypothetical protein